MTGLWTPVLLLILLASGAFSEKLSECHVNPCQNNGKCFKIEQPGTFCEPPYQITYENSCYMFVREQLSWQEAEKRCAVSRHAPNVQSITTVTDVPHLVTVNSEQERAFLQTFIQDNLHNTGSGETAVNVWTGGRFIGESVRKNDGFKWKKSTSGTLEDISTFFWAVGQPGYTVTNDTCISISAESSFWNWISNSCDHDQNAFVCERPIQTAHEGYIDRLNKNSYFYQCRCKTGFVGLHCEQSSQSERAQNILCGSSQSLPPQPIPLFSCHENQDRQETIEVDYAVYGQPFERGDSSFGSCGIEQQNVAVTCQAPGSFLQIRQLCQGKKTCVIPSLDKLFANPCGKLRPENQLLEYRFRCSPAAEKKLCPPQTHLIGYRCYDISINEESKSWQDARNVCQRRGGDLAGPIGFNENEWMAPNLFASVERGKVGRLHMHDQSVFANAMEATFWIGLRTSNEPKWVSTSEAIQDYSPEGANLSKRGCGAYSVSKKRRNRVKRGKGKKGKRNTYREKGPTRDNWRLDRRRGKGKAVSESVTWVTRNCNEAHQWICEFAPLSSPPKRLQGSLTTTSQPSTYYSEEATTAASSATPTTTMPTRSNSTTTEAPTTESLKTDLCSNISFANGSQWPSAQLGEASTVPCPNGKKGFAHWLCTKSNGIALFAPEGPDYSGCRIDWIQDLSEKAKIGESAESIIEDLNGHLSKTDLSESTITESVDLMSDLVFLEQNQLSLAKLNMHEKQKKCEKFVNLLGQSSNTLLSKAEPWTHIATKQKLEDGTKLLRNLEDSAEMLSHYLQDSDTRKFQFQNIEIEVTYKDPYNPPPSDDEGLEGTRYKPTSILESNADWPNSAVNPKSSIRLPTLDILSTATGQADTTGADNGTPDTFSQEDSPVPETKNGLRIGRYLFPSGMQDILAPIMMKTTSNGSKIINSQIIGATINNPRVSKKLPVNAPVVLKLYHLKTKGVKSPQCVFWNVGALSWDSSGCWINETGVDYTVCACDHLTVFAILMDVSEGLQEVNSLHYTILTWITRIGCSISITALILAIAVFTFVRQLWCRRITVHRNLCICLLCAELLFLFGIDATNLVVGCKVIAVLMHYFLLAAFVWMALEGYQLYLMLIKVLHTESPSPLYYYLTGYGSPLLVVGTAAGLRFDSYGTSKYCWIDAQSPTVWAFVVPVGLVVLGNLVTLFVSMRVACNARIIKDRGKANIVKNLIKGSLILLCLLGSTWAFGFFIILYPTALHFAYLFTILNSLQGFWIFLFHVLFNEKVCAAVFRFLRKHCANYLPMWMLHSNTFSNSSFSGQRKITSPDSSLTTHLPNSPVNTNFPGSNSYSDNNYEVIQPDIIVANQIAAPKLSMGHLCSKHCSHAIDFNACAQEFSRGPSSPTESGNNRYSVTSDSFPLCETLNDCQQRITTSHVYENPTFVQRF